MIDVLEPQNVLLRRFVDSIYIFKKSTGAFEFTAYPTVNTPVALFRNVDLSIIPGGIHIRNSDTPNHFATACNQFFSGIYLRYSQLVDEIAINFKPLGLASFSVHHNTLHSSHSQLRRKSPGINHISKELDSKYGYEDKNNIISSKDQHEIWERKSEKLFYIESWNEFLPALFNNVFATDDPKQQLYHIEKFLLEQYVPLPEEAILLKALELLNDTAKDYKMQEIASIVGLHYKQLYRLFMQNIGCSLAHYRKLVKFRSSVVSKINKGNKTRWVDVCYDNGYTDQPYFIKQLKGLTGEKPTSFFKGVTSFGNDKIIFKID